VIQYVYTRYGAAGAAMTANVITYRDRSASREIGKVLGIPPRSSTSSRGTCGRFEYIDPKDTLESRLARAGWGKPTGAWRSSRGSSRRSRTCRGTWASTRAGW
jgi:hypothetical protein